MPRNAAATNLLSSFLHSFSASFSAFRSPISHLIQIQLLDSFNQAVALTIPILTNLLQLRKTDPFSTHPKTMHLAISTTVLFYTAYTALLRFPLRRRLATAAGHCLLSIGNASVASLASLLLPDSLRLFVFLVFGLLSAAELIYWLYNEFVTEEDEEEEYNVRRMRVSMFFQNICSTFTNITGQTQPILPV